MYHSSFACLELPSENEVSTGLESLKQLAGEIQEGVMAIRAQPAAGADSNAFQAKLD